VLNIQSARRDGDDVHVVWEKKSGQEDTIIPIDFLINNYPVIEVENYEMENFKSSHVLWFFDYKDLFDDNGNKNPEPVYRYNTFTRTVTLINSDKKNRFCSGLDPGLDPGFCSRLKSF
jgi:hypothetical protein